MDNSSVEHSTWFVANVRRSRQNGEHGNLQDSPNLTKHPIRRCFCSTWHSSECSQQLIPRTFRRSPRTRFFINYLYISAWARWDGRGLLLCFLPHVVTVRGECESGWDVLTLFEHVTPGEDPRPPLVFVENGPENDTKKCKQNVNDFIYYNDVEQHRRSWPHFALGERIYCPKFFLTLPYNCSSLSCWIKNTFTFYPLPLLPGRRLSQLELHLAMNHRIYLASVKQVLLNTCPKHDEKRLNAMWHSRPRGRRKMNLESPGRGGAGVWVD